MSIDVEIPIRTLGRNFARRPRRFDACMGPLFGYRGWFHAGRKAIGADGIPVDVEPAREEPRE